MYNSNSCLHGIDGNIAGGRKAERTLKRAKAMTQVSSQILNIARIQVQAIKTAESCGLLNEDMPALIATKDSKAGVLEQKKEKQKLLEAVR